MADLGALNTVLALSVGSIPPTLAKPASAMVKYKTAGKQVIPLWLSDSLHVDTSSEIAVTVMVQGVVQERVFCKCVHRKSGRMVGAGFTNAAGEITFQNLSKDEAEGYYVVAFSEEDYNALIYDKLTAV